MTDDSTCGGGVKPRLHCRECLAVVYRLGKGIDDATTLIAVGAVLLPQWGCGLRGGLVGARRVALPHVLAVWSWRLGGLWATRRLWWLVGRRVALPQHNKTCCGSR